VRWGAVIVAAGRGERFGGPKQLAQIAGRPLIAWSISTLGTMPEILDLAIATEPEYIETIAALCAESAPRLGARVVAGGATRQESVRAALRALPERCSAILVHDGARPLVLSRDVRAAMGVVRKGTASLLAARVIDTIKVVEPSRGIVLRTLDRADLWAAQTPQCATSADLRRAHRDAERHGIAATDDATLLERAGLDVVVVPTSGPNFKITLPGDAARAEVVLAAREPIAASQEEILLLEAFVSDEVSHAVARELEARRGRIDAIERDLPDAVIVRSYVPAEALDGFGERFAQVAGHDAIFTTHHAHLAPRPPH
jgi:2-C-methyl-D-erythritol 4-phosphate cytidylyltransferase